MPSYIQDTNDFLRKINKIEKIPDNSYLLSLDVRSLYTSIKAIKRPLESFPGRTVATSNHFLSLILTLNNFVFNCKNYLQGCVMETICSTVYVNIFSEHFERKWIYPLLEGL